MKMIVAVIQPFMFTKLTRALKEIEDLPGMTVSDVQGFGREKAHLVPGEQHRRIEDVVDFVKKVRVEIVAHNFMVDQIVETIARTTNTGNRSRRRGNISERAGRTASLIYDAPREAHETEIVDTREAAT